MTKLKTQQCPGDAAEAICGCAFACVQQPLVLGNSAHWFLLPGRCGLPRITALLAAQQGAARDLATTAHTCAIFRTSRAPVHLRSKQQSSTPRPRGRRPCFLNTSGRGSERRPSRPPIHGDPHRPPLSTEGPEATPLYPGASLLSPRMPAETPPLPALLGKPVVRSSPPVQGVLQPHLPDPPHGLLNITSRPALLPFSVLSTSLVFM